MERVIPASARKRTPGVGRRHAISGTTDTPQPLATNASTVSICALRKLTRGAKPLSRQNCNACPARQCPSFIRINASCSKSSSVSRRFFANGCAAGRATSSFSSKNSSVTSPFRSTGGLTSARSISFASTAAAKRSVVSSCTTTSTAGNFALKVRSRCGKKYGATVGSTPSATRPRTNPRNSRTPAHARSTSASTRSACAVNRSPAGVSATSRFVRSKSRSPSSASSFMIC